MFNKGDYVFYGSGGVCSVDDIVVDPFEGMHDGRSYYVLRSVCESNGTMFVPVDNQSIFIRHIISKEEADALIKSFPDIDEIDEPSPKLLRDRFSESMKTNDPREWMRVIKTIFARRAAFLERSKRISDSELSVFDRAKRYLHAELSLALSIPREEIESYIKNRLEEKNAG